MEIEFNIKKGINHVYIPVYVNDKGPYNFTLDTGAQATTLSSILTEELGLETTELIGEKYDLYKEKRNLKQVKAVLRIGDEELITDEVWSMNLGFSTKTSGKNVVQKVIKSDKEGTSSEDPNLRKMMKKTESGEKIIHATQGVIGYTTLKNYYLSVNYKTNIMKLESRREGYINENLNKMQKFEFIGNTHLVGIPVKVNENGPYSFVVDTGAGGTTISKILYETLDLPLSDMLVKAVGIHGAQETRIAIIDEMTVSSNSYQNIDAVVIDESMTGPKGKIIENGIVGFNIFRNRELIIDYLNQTCAIV